MNILAAIFQTEFIRRVRSRPYLLGTIIGALAIASIALLPPLVERAFASSNANIVLAGDPALVDRAKPLIEKDYHVVATMPALPHVDNAFLDAHQKAAAAILLEEHDGLHATAYARDPGAFRSAFARDLVPLNIAVGAHLSEAQAKRYIEVPVTIRSTDARFADEKAAESARGVAYMFVMLLYLSILLNAQAIMSSVAEEKTSRIAEVLVATVRPSILLTGKMFASAATGVLQLAVWIAAGFAAGQLVAQQTAHAAASGETPAATAIIGAIDISTGEVLAFLTFFLVGFVQYALMYAAAASLINRTEDLGSVAGPLVVPVVGAFLLAQYTLGFPNATNVAIFSQIPLIAPFVMFTRIVVASVPAWQIALSIAINVVAAVLIAIGAGKIYRVGLLMYGRAPKLSQVWAVLRT